MSLRISSVPNHACQDSQGKLSCFLCSISFSIGSSQAAKADSNTQTPTNWKGAHPKLRDQLKKKKKSSKKVFKMLQEKMLKLQRVVTDQFLQRTSQRMQCLLPGDQPCTRASRNREKKMGHLLSQIVNLVWSNTVKKLKFQVPLPCSDSRCVIKAGHQALSSWQTGQPRPRLGDFEAAFASCTLSKRGTDIYEFYHSGFQSYDAYQTDKYHKDENPLVRWDSFESPNHEDYTESCA